MKIIHKYNLFPNFDFFFYFSYTSEEYIKVIIVHPKVHVLFLLFM